MYKIDYKVDKTKNCVLVDSNDWLYSSSNLIREYRLSGKKVLSYVTKALEVNLLDDYESLVKKGDIILLSRVVSEISQYKSHALLQDKKYYDVPIMQVLGVFESDLISFETLSLITNKVLYKKEIIRKGIFQVSDSAATIGRIIKVGPDVAKVKETDLALFVDNVSTRITLNGEEYFVTDETAIICLLQEDGTLEQAKFLNEYILMTPYIPEKLSEHLWTPSMNYEDEDYTDIYKRDRFKVSYVDTNLTGIEKNDIIWIDRNVTMYAFFDGVQYFITRGKEHLEFKELQSEV